MFHDTRTQAGFTYLAVLIAIAMMGVALAAAGTVWATSRQREREQELLFAGDEIRHAIALYYLDPDAGAHQFPAALADLLEDRRAAVPHHHLRRLYRDPMTGSTDWQVVLSAEGTIMGVFSASRQAPIKRANFKAVDADFTDAECYCDWKFVYKVRGKSPRQQTNVDDNFSLPMTSH